MKLMMNNFDKWQNNIFGILCTNDLDVFVTDNAYIGEMGYNLACLNNKEKKQPNISWKNYYLGCFNHPKFSLFWTYASCQPLQESQIYVRTMILLGSNTPKVHTNWTIHNDLRNGNVICFQSPTWDPDQKTHHKPSVHEKRAQSSCSSTVSWSPQHII